MLLSPLPRSAPVLVVLLLVSVTGQAAWEDTGATPSRAPATTSHGRTATPAPRPPAPRPAPDSGSRPLPASHRGIIPPDLYSTHLDSVTEPQYWGSLTYIHDTEVGDTGETIPLVELDAAWQLLYLRDVLLGDLDGRLSFHSLIFGDDAGQAILPTALLALPFDLGWTWRYLHGGSLQVRGKPGLYTDAGVISGDSLSVPFQFAYFHAFTPRLSGVAGVEIRPDWDLVAMPLLGIAWEPVDFWRLEFGVPAARTKLALGPLSIIGTAAWRNTTYAMSGEGDKPDQLTVEDVLLSAGLQVEASDTLTIAAEVGTLLGRSMTASGDVGEDDIDLRQAPFLRLTFGGPF